MKMTLCFSCVLIALANFTVQAWPPLTDDPAKDFDPLGNPACEGAWSYGYALQLGGSMSLLTNQAGTNGLSFWRRHADGPGEPLVMLNQRPCLQYHVYGTSVLPGKQLALRPGPQSEYAAVCWTAPTGGTYALTAIFTSLDDAGNSKQDAHVLLNGAAIFSETIKGYQAQSSLTRLIEVAADDQICFVVGSGGDNSSHDTVGLNASIQQADVTPPTVTAGADRDTLWPPNGKMVRVVIGGSITDSESGVAPGSAYYTVADEYGTPQPSGAVSVGPDGGYAFEVYLQAKRRGNDRDGRYYVVTVGASDVAGHPASTSVSIVVPHNK